MNVSLVGFRHVLSILSGVSRIRVFTHKSLRSKEDRFKTTVEDDSSRPIW